MDNGYTIAVLGATGAVGETMLSILQERQFPVKTLFPLASSNSAGETLEFKGEELEILDADGFDFGQCQIALFSAGGSVSAKYAPIAAEAGCVVIDNTSHFRNEPDIPLIIPEVNLNTLSDYRARNIIANPNCSTIQMLIALKPIYDAVGISRIIVSTYQSVSGAGRSGIGELAERTADFLNGTPSDPEVFSHSIAFNLIPQIDTWEDNGYSREEMKMHWETQKIFADPEIMVNATCVRVPVFYGHAESITIETRGSMDAQQAKELLRGAPGVVLCEDDELPTPHWVANQEDATYVARVRDDISKENSLSFWVVADNIRKGAALNAIQIAEALIEQWGA